MLQTVPHKSQMTLEIVLWTDLIRPATDPALKDLTVFSISVLETSIGIWETLGTEGHSRSDGMFRGQGIYCFRCE